MHLHTTASDGQLRPSELVQLARQHAFNAIAITDHDTTAGIPEAQQTAQGWPVIVPGIELSADDDGVDVHVLGYDIDIENAPFQAELARFREDRLGRARRIVERLAQLGLPVAWERVLHLADGGSVGRPHIARALLEAGHVESVRDAFDRYLYTGGPAYVARARLTPEAAIALIHSAAGVAVLAHPGLVPHYFPLIEERLIPAGLDGLEIMHPKNPEAVRQNLQALARRYDLLITGGSDFHRPGDPIGAVQPPADSLHLLRQRVARRAQP